MLTSLPRSPQLPFPNFRRGEAVYGVNSSLHFRTRTTSAEVEPFVFVPTTAELVLLLQQAARECVSGAASSNSMLAGPAQTKSRDVQAGFRLVRSTLPRDHLNECYATSLSIMLFFFLGFSSYKLCLCAGAGYPLGGSLRDDVSSDFVANLFLKDLTRLVPLPLPSLLSLVYYSCNNVSNNNHTVASSLSAQNDLMIEETTVKSGNRRRPTFHEKRTATTSRSLSPVIRTCFIFSRSTYACSSGALLFFPFPLPCMG
jgi:hypothetical protein